MPTVYAFVDGGHVRAGLTRLGVDWELVDFASATKRNSPFAPRLRPTRLFVYDAAPDDDAGAVDRWLRRHDALPDVHVRYGKLAGSPTTRRRQKGVDIQLAVDALNYSANNVYDYALLITGDGDFAPLAEALRDRGTHVAVCAFKDSLSADLAREADRVYYLPEEATFWSNHPLPIADGNQG